MPFCLHFRFTSLATSIFPCPRAIYMGYGCESNNNPLCLKPFASLYSPYSSVGLRLWRTTRCMLWRASMDLYHRTSASIIKRVHLVMPSLPQGIGPIPFGLWGPLRRPLVASSFVVRGGRLMTTICLPPSIGMARASLNASPS